MTKEQAAYAAALNLLGSGIPDPDADALLRLTLGDLRYDALASEMPAGPKVRCPRCPTPFLYDGPTDGEHFAELWEHLITRHHYDARNAEDPALVAWRHPLPEGVMAA